jgi:hypothetical protein
MVKFLFEDVASGDTDDGNTNALNIQMVGLVFVYKRCVFCVRD